jgi:hypothetical protein
MGDTGLPESREGGAAEVAGRRQPWLSRSDLTVLLYI